MNNQTMKKYLFTCVSTYTLEVKRYKYDLMNDEMAQSFGTWLLEEFKYECVTVEEIREVIHIKGRGK